MLFTDNKRELKYYFSFLDNLQTSEQIPFLSHIMETNHTGEIHLKFDTDSDSFADPEPLDADSTGHIGYLKPGLRIRIHIFAVPGSGSKVFFNTF